MQNHIEQLNTINDFSFEQIKDHRKLLEKLQKNNNKKMQLFDLDIKFKKKIKFTPKPTLHDIRKISWFPQTDLPIAKDNMGIVYIDDKIYTVGGRTDIGNDCLLQHEDSLVQMYDINTKQWSNKEKMLYPHTGNVAVGAGDGNIYSFGGYLKLPDSIRPEDYALYQIIFKDPPISGLLQKYDPSTNTWERKNSSDGRVFSAGVATEDGSIYIFGGYEVQRFFYDSENPSAPSYKIVNAGKTLKYSIANDKWEYVANMPTPRSGLAAVLGKDGKIYVMGGLGDDCQWQSTVEVYDPETNTWEKNTDMPTPRGAFSAVVDGFGKIYAIGGVSLWHSINNVEIYDPSTNNWENGPDITPDRMSHGAIITDDDIIYVIGGLQCQQNNSIPLLLSSNKNWNTVS